MADDSLDVTVPFENSPDANPHSMLGYDFGALTHDQQRQLNIFKVNTVREDHIYLATHPEIRASVCLLLRAFCNIRPQNVHEFASYFMSRPDIPKLIADFVKNEETVKIKVVAKNEKTVEKLIRGERVRRYSRLLGGSIDSRTASIAERETGCPIKSGGLAEALFPSSRFVRTSITSQRTGSTFSEEFLEELEEWFITPRDGSYRDEVKEVVKDDVPEEDISSKKSEDVESEDADAAEGNIQQFLDDVEGVKYHMTGYRSYRAPENEDEALTE